MSRRLIAGSAAILFLGVFVAVAFAAPPLDGVVVEGDSVPGVALGDTREEVYLAYGEPDRSQYDAAFCTWILKDHLGQGGHAQSQVTVNFIGADGGTASNAPDDVVMSISFYGLDGWVTTAGINTQIAADFPEAVFDAYPDAEVTHSLFVTTLRDWRAGVQVHWQTNYLNQATLVNIAIFTPQEPPPPPPPREPSVRVSEIEMSTAKRTVIGTVRTLNDLNWRVSGIDVHATWTLPDGSTRPVVATTDGFGLVEFVLRKARRGTYVLAIDDLVLEGHDFDADNSVLSASIVKRK